jgi:hypothetical protein
LSVVPKQIDALAGFFEPKPMQRTYSFGLSENVNAKVDITGPADVENLEALKDYVGVRLPPGLTQTVKTLLAVRWKILDRQDDCTAYWFPAGEAEAGCAGEQPAEE